MKITANPNIAYKYTALNDDLRLLAADGQVAYEIMPGPDQPATSKLDKLWGKDLGFMLNKVRTPSRIVSVTLCGCQQGKPATYLLGLVIRSPRSRPWVRSFGCGV